MRRAALLVSLLLAGCAARQPAQRAEPEVRVVSVAVPVPCACPTPPARPHLPVADLVDEAPPADVLRAYLTSLELLAGYARELEAVAGACSPAVGGEVR